MTCLKEEGKGGMGDLDDFTKKNLNYNNHE